MPDRSKSRRAGLAGPTRPDSAPTGPSRLSLEVLGSRIDLDLSHLDPVRAQEVAAAWDGAATQTGSPSQDGHAPASGGASPVAPVAVLVPRVESDHEVRTAASADLQAREPLAQYVWGISTEALMERLSSAVTVAAINAREDELLMLHAAGLADEEGNVVALVGPSGRGKTTATRHLAQRFGYLSDETVGIDPEGRVLAHRKPLSVIEPDTPHKVQRGVGELGLRPAPPDPRIAAVVVLDRRTDGPEQATVEPVDTLDALALLVEQASYLPSTRGGLQWIARLGDLTGGFQRIVYREAGTLDAAVEEVLSLAAQGDPSARIRPADGGPHPTGVVAPTEPIGAEEILERAGRVRFGRARANDCVERDGEVALLVGTRLLRVAGIGPVLWERLAQEATVEQLTAAVVEAFGEPEGADPRTLVAQALARLSQDGALRVLTQE
ncbi:hypothetical protein [Serinibacter salmoneus]|uniref:Coenzyme PQQ synthesis protein D (PqqD) n=1 Tax=Serinibacter salmoneus TaxID=556530 RepID=A0A2A9D3Z0_9MICO|nr:hypothetical protein [Serinibacter salmoneus]PFG21056.1 hypothetical protein ATL40_2676 [Serinibacter salmoneus]